MIDDKISEKKNTSNTEWQKKYDQSNTLTQPLKLQVKLNSDLVHVSWQPN